MIRSGHSIANGYGFPYLNTTEFHTDPKSGVVYSAFYRNRDRTGEKCLVGYDHQIKRWTVLFRNQEEGLDPLPIEGAST